MASGSRVYECYKNDRIYASDKLFFARYFSGRMRILDVGCSYGHRMRLHPELKWGVEIDPEAVRSATSEGLRVSRCDISREEFPFPSKCFDGVECRHVLEHLDLSGRLNALSEMRRVCRGIVVVEIPDVESMGWRYFDTFEHQLPMTRRGFEDLLREYFESVVIRRPHTSFPLANHLPLSFGLTIQNVFHVCDRRSLLAVCEAI
jgi:SAM-dependent methyltransferase